MRAVALVALLASAACSAPLGGAPRTGSPGLRVATSADIEAIALRADQLRTAATAGAASEQVAEMFAGRAAALLRRDSMREQQRHERIETVVDARAVVHLSTGEAPSAVVQSSGRQRVVAGAAASRWDSFVDQWLYTLRWSGGWRVWESVELPPGEWWPA